MSQGNVSDCGGLIARSRAQGHAKEATLPHKTPTSALRNASSYEVINAKYFAEFCKLALDLQEVA